MQTFMRIATLAVITLSFFAAEAGPRNQRVGGTQVHQNKRIAHGVRTGELMRSEAKELRAEQREINKMRREAKRDDGRIDRSELKDIRKEQEDASKNIYQEKHDAEQR